jgi:hypothetical protein
MKLTLRSLMKSIIGPIILRLLENVCSTAAHCLPCKFFFPDFLAFYWCFFIKFPAYINICTMSLPKVIIGFGDKKENSCYE